MTASTKSNRRSSIVSASSNDADLSDSGDLSLDKTNANTSRRSSSKRASRRSSTKAKTVTITSATHPARAFVEHHYHDHARDPIAKPAEMVGHRADSVMSRSFPEKLHQLLEAMQEDGLEHIVSWQPHGRCFVIHQKAEFVKDIMSRFFMQTKLTSFQRQLNLYGFIRLTTGADRGGYYHEYFLRGRPDLCRFMVRTRVKGIGMKAASSPATEPDLYKYETCPVDGPLPTNWNCEDSVSSDSTADPVNTSMLPELTFPSIVSPPESPMNSLSIATPPELLPDLSLLDVTTRDDLVPHTGDEVFFEGLAYRYLDHLDLDDVQEMTVTNVEYL